MLYPYPDPQEWPQLAQLARTADELGYFAVFLPEHVLPPLGAEDHLANTVWPDNLTLAAFLACCTERLRFIPGVSVVPYHPPIQYAKQLATLDQLSQGRVILGVGTGWYREEFDRLGLPFADRSAITDEYLAAMVELWTAEHPSFAGRYISFGDVSFEPKPFQRPYIPLLIGGSGSRPARRVVTLGAGWYPMTGTTSERTRDFEDMRKAAERAGRDPTELWLVGSCNMGTNPAQERASRHVADGRSRQLPDDAFSTTGLVSQVAEQVEAGASLILVRAGWESLDELMASLRRFADEVFPAFAATGAS